MASFYTVGSKVQFDGYKGVVLTITETYRKNVLVVKLTEFPKYRKHKKTSTTLGLFEYPDGRLEFMAFLE